MTRTPDPDTAARADRESAAELASSILAACYRLGIDPETDPAHRDRVLALALAMIRRADAERETGRIAP